MTEGGSTLTQQLVKNYYLTGERTYKRKVTEAFMAVILDAKYSKREILEAVNGAFPVREVGREHRHAMAGSAQFFAHPVHVRDDAVAVTA